MELIGSKLGAPYKTGGLLCPIEKVYQSVEEKTAIDAAKSKELEAAVQNMMDSAAKAKGYDSILSACTYAAYPNQFQADGQEFVAWRGAVWAKCYEILGEVEAGTRPAPTVSELLAEIAATTTTLTPESGQ